MANMAERENPRVIVAAGTSLAEYGDGQHYRDAADGDSAGRRWEKRRDNE